MEATSFAKKTILILGEYGSLNGGEHSLLAAIPALIEAGFQLKACVPCGAPAGLNNSDYGFAGELEKAGVTVESFSFFDEAGIRLSQDEIRESISGLIARLRPDLVHANSLSVARLLGPVVHQADVKYLGYFRDILKLSKKAIKDLNQLDCVVAVSQATADFHIGQGIDPAKIEVVHNGVDLQKFCPQAECQTVGEITPTIREELGLSPDAEICLFVGQIGMRKGIDLLLKIMSPLCNQRSGLHLLIVGARHSSKEEAEEYEHQMHEKSQTDFPANRVHWLGRRSDVDRIMREANVLVHPAKQEPLGRVLLEAAASGLPVVTTDVGGSREIFSDQPHCLFGLGEPDDLATASKLVKRLLDDGDICQQTSIALRGIAVSKFSSKLAGDNLVRTYRLLLGGQ